MAKYSIYFYDEHGVFIWSKDNISFEEVTQYLQTIIIKGYGARVTLTEV